MTSQHRVLRFAMVAAAALALSACGSTDADTASATVPTQPASTPAPSPSSPSPSSPSAAATTPTTVPSAQTPTQQQANCGRNPQASAITENISRVPPAQQPAARAWQYEGDSNYDPCADLSYAELETSGGTGSAPQQIMLFHRGDYLGTTTKCAFGFTSVTATSADSIGVTYKWPRQGDSNANPSGRVSVTYQWDGNKVQMKGTLPAELLTISGCQA